MKTNKSELGKQAQELGKIAASDHLTNLVKAALNAVPFVGGPIASLIDDYIPQSRQKRIEQFARDLAVELEQAQDSLDTDYVRTDEYAYLFTKVFQDVSRDYQEEKLSAYRNILINSLRVEVSASIQERYLAIVEQLTPMHLRILSAFVSDSANAPKLAPLRNHLSGSISQTLTTLLPDIEEIHIASCLHDLDQLGVTGSIASSFKAMGTSRGMSSLEGRLTPFGRSFLNFIMVTSERVAGD